MESSVYTVLKLFSDVSARLEEFVSRLREKSGKEMATDVWTVDDVLRHITFWHMNYSQNYEALAGGTPPPLLDGPGYRLNTDGVASLKKFTRRELEGKLWAAHKSLGENILVKKIPRMTYRVRGRTYSSLEFLEVVDAHLRGHIRQIRRAKLLL